MLIYPDIDPVAFRAFGFPVRWYGLMYLFALGLAVAYGRRALARKPMFADAGTLQIVDFVTAAALGVILGGRLGYAILYKFGDYVQDPISVFYLWQGGMSFHGGLMGAIIAVAIYARRANVSFLRLTDLAVLLAPPGLGLGRIGNFIGGELPGRIASADLPWAMIYRHIDNMPRHPSQLYQAFLEGVVLAVLMILLSRKWRPAGWLSAMFLISYGVLRFISEFFREPDAHLGLQLFDLSRGQWLSLPMMVVGVGVLLILPRRHKKKRQKTSGINIGGVLTATKRIILSPVRSFAKKSGASADVRADINTDNNTATTITQAKTTTAAEVAISEKKPAFAFVAFALAAGGYVCHLPVRFWSYMRNDEPQRAEVLIMEETAAKRQQQTDNKKGALWNFFFDDNEPAAKAADQTAEAYGDNDKEESDDGDKKGGLWNFFFADNEPAAAEESEDDNRQAYERQQKDKKKPIHKEADWDDGIAADDGVNDDNDEYGGGERTKKRGGFFNFFFADDDGDDGDDGNTLRQSRRDKRRMKKKKRR